MTFETDDNYSIRLDSKWKNTVRTALLLICVV